MTRPEGNNADEWMLYIRELRLADQGGAAHLAVQIAEAIDDAVERCAKIVDAHAIYADTGERVKMAAADIRKLVQ